MPESSTPLPLRPRSATEIVDAAFQLYRRDPFTYLLISALCYSPILVLQLVAIGPGAQVEQDLARLTAGFMGIMAVGYWISVSLLNAAILRIAAEDYMGRRIEPSVAVRDALLRLPAVMFSMLFKYILMAIGFLFFLVGALYVVARYFAIVAAIVVEGQGVFSSFGRSATLSRGRKWHILLTLLLAFLIFFIGYFAVVIVSAMIGNAVITTIMTVVVSILAYPMFAITEMLLYYDARVRNEGYDIEMMAEAI